MPRKLKQLADLNWGDVLDRAKEMRLTKWRMAQNDLELTFVDPFGEEFVVGIKCKAEVGLAANLLTINTSFFIAGFEWEGQE